ncbi:hypothetical protein PACTADRAFT_35790 [Pachysolen tannophilus NRRL Y-2460]|uniref:Uncharacterized protein n=1 Tax=Pachysolen tannophilus NRRL Y-2460 TaxID=669874 RepID=A0A1E4TN10_PACTA|nr:hypothetical protein PACTADRAFT_35790 [Pachysolen tannophilus NRRL Y-2460]
MTDFQYQGSDQSYRSPNLTYNSHQNRNEIPKDRTQIADNRTPVSAKDQYGEAVPWKKKKLYNSPFPRYRHTASTTSSDAGTTFVMGGLRDGNVYGDIWKINAVKNDQTSDYSYIAKPIENFDCIPAPRVGHSSILIGNAFIVYGGDTIQLNSSGELDNSLYFFNINSLKWTIPQPQGLKPKGRYGHSITVVTFQNEIESEEASWSSYLYLFGGQLDEETFNDMWCFDLRNFRKPTTQWKMIYDNNKGKISRFQPPPLSNHTMTVYEGKIFIFGGVTMNGTLSNKLYCFNPFDESWKVCNYSSTYQPPALEEHAATLYQNYLISYGGKDSNGFTLDHFIAINLDTFEAFKISTNGLNAPGRRSGHSITYDLVNEKLLIMGGDQLDSENNNSREDIVVLDSINDTDNDDLLELTGIDPNEFEYKTTYIYEFDLSRLEDYILESVNIAIMEDNSKNENNEVEQTYAIPKSALNETDSEIIQASEESKVPFETHSTKSISHPEDDEIFSSTPLRQRKDTKRSDRVSSSSHNTSIYSGSSGVKRIDSISVAKNRRIRSGGSVNNNDNTNSPENSKNTRTKTAEIINSSKNVTPVLRQVSQSKQHKSPPVPQGHRVKSGDSQIYRDDSKIEESGSQNALKAETGTHSNINNDKFSSKDTENNGFNKLEEEMNEFKKSSDAISANINISNFDKDSRSNLLDPAVATGSSKEADKSFLNHHNESVTSNFTMSSLLDKYSGKYSGSESTDKLFNNVHTSNDDDNSGDSLNRNISNNQDTPVLNKNSSFKDNDSSSEFKSLEEELTNNKGLKDDKSESKDTSLPVLPISSQNDEQIPKNAMDSAVALQLYEKLNFLKKSLSDKMVVANQNIINLEKENKAKENELNNLSTEVSTKDVTINSLKAELSELTSSHEKQEILLSSNQKSLGAHESAVSSLEKELEMKNLKISSLFSQTQEQSLKISAYEDLINQKILSLEKFKNILSKQQIYIKNYQLSAIKKEEELTKKIHELSLQNENLKLEFENYKKVHSSIKTNDSYFADKTFDLNNEDIENSSGQNDYNENSINDLSAGIDKFLEVFKGINSSPNQLASID